MCTINNTSGIWLSCNQCAVESVSKVATKRPKLEGYQLDKARGLSKLKSLTERLHSPLQLSDMDSIITQSLSHQKGLTTISMYSVAIACQVSLCSYLVDYGLEGNTVL